MTVVKVLAWAATLFVGWAVGIFLTGAVFGIVEGADAEVSDFWIYIGGGLGAMGGVALFRWYQQRRARREDAESGR